MNQAYADPPLGLVYTWKASEDDGPWIAERTIVPLRHLLGGTNRKLHGRFVAVRNDAVVNTPGSDGLPRPAVVGDAEPDEQGNFIFEPGRGGGRIDKITLADSDFRWRYLQAARFGETNTYFHLDRIAGHIDTLLGEIGAASLPPVVAVVNAHPASAGDGDGRDGQRFPDGHIVPFQGGHYRVPGKMVAIRERAALSANGEIHLGPGHNLTAHGAMARHAGGPYRVNASHNPPIIYHEYGHHVCRHSADFRANRLRPPDRQSNRKTALDEGTADYFAAAMLGTPDIWFFHHRTGAGVTHRRSLRSPRTMESYLRGPAADAHANGTIWAAALWDLRARVMRRSSPPTDGAGVDRLLLQALLLIGKDDPGDSREVTKVVSARCGFRRAAAALLEADGLLYRGELRDLIVDALAARGIHPDRRAQTVGASDAA